MPGDGSLCLWPSAMMVDALIQANYMAVGPILLMHANDIGRFEIDPFQVVVDVRSQPADADFAAAGRQRAAPRSRVTS
jgi:hypothetical protein